MIKGKRKMRFCFCVTSDKTINGVTSEAVSHTAVADRQEATKMSYCIYSKFR
jgi:hypothetical protein